MEHFGKYQYQLRMRKGNYISQQKLAELSGFTQTYISLVETRKAQPSRGYVRLVLDALGVFNLEYMKRYNAI